MQTSERIRPGFVLFHGNITIFAEHISEITKCNTLANLVSFVRRIGDALYLPEITELIKNLCFGVTHLVEIPLTFPILKFTGPAPWSYWSAKRNYSFWAQKSNPSNKKLYANIKLIFIFNQSYQCIRLKRWYLRVSTDHPEKQTICRDPFSWATKKCDMSSKSKKEDQNENWAPTIRGMCFCPSSYVVRRGDRFFPGTLFQDRHRRPQAAGEPEKTPWRTFLKKMLKKTLCRFFNKLLFSGRFQKALRKW